MIVLWPENKFQPNSASVSAEFEFWNSANFSFGRIWKSQIRCNPTRYHHLTSLHYATVYFGWLCVILATLRTLIDSLIHWFIDSLIDLLILWFIDSFIDSLMSVCISVCLCVDIESASNNEVFTSVHALLMTLYNRDCRRAFTPAGHWLVRFNLQFLTPRVAYESYYFLSLTPSVCLSQTSNWFFVFVSRWNQAILGRQFFMTPSTKRSSIFDLGP